MTPVLVWLLVISNPTYSNSFYQVQAPYFATAADCERVKDSFPTPQYPRSEGHSARIQARAVCVQATVYIQEPKALAVPNIPANKGKN